MSKERNLQTHEKIANERYSLPTTPEIVTQGKLLYEDLLESAPFKIREEIEKNDQVLISLLGIHPTAGESSPTGIFAHESEARSFLEKFSADNGDKLLFKRHTQTDPSIERVSFINLASAYRIIKLNLDIFPKEAIEQTQEWLNGNLELWFIKSGYLSEPDAPLLQTRYGVLSGFPRPAAEAFVYLRRGLTKIKDNSTEEEYHEIWKYIIAGESREIQNQEDLEKKIRNKYTEVEDEERAAVVQVCHVTSKTLSYFGNNCELDYQYVNSADKIYLEAKSRSKSTRRRI